MNQKQWNHLRRSMAVLHLRMQMADMMIPVAQSEPRILRWMNLSDANDDTKDRAGVQRWRNAEHDMGSALIALERMGYEIRSKTG